MLTYVFMGSPEFAVVVLRNLVEEIGPPSLVLTQPPRPQGRSKTPEPTSVEVWAKAQNFLVVPTSNVNDPRLILKLKLCDTAVVAAFGQILKEEALQAPKLGCLNVHASLLPKYRGAAPIQRAIQNGEIETGVTIQRIVRRLDAGDILLQKKCGIDLSDSSIDLFDRLAKLGGVASVEALKILESGRANFVPQAESEATIAPKIEKSEASIHWSENAKTIRNKIRAFQPWPIAQTTWDNTHLKIFKAEISNGFGSEIGTVKTDGSHFFMVQCGEGTALQLEEVQLENRKRLLIRNFLQGIHSRYPKNLG